MDGVERVMVLGIFAVIVAILSIVAWDVTNEDPDPALGGVADGGISSGAGPVSPKVMPSRGDLETKFDELLGTSGQAGAVKGAATQPGRGRLAQAKTGRSVPPAGQQTTTPKPPQSKPLQPDSLPLEPKMAISQPSASPQLEGARRLDGLELEGLKPLRPASAVETFRSYTVQEGDTLWRVANSLGQGDKNRMVDEILRLNSGLDPQFMAVGQVLRLPTALPDGVRTKTVIERAKSEGQRLYEVQPGDTLSQIAEAELGSSRRWEEIYRLNQRTISDPGNVYAGLTILLPAQ